MAAMVVPRNRLDRSWESLKGPSRRMLLGSPENGAMVTLSRFDVRLRPGRSRRSEACFST